jgi:hypothetical protein
MSDVAARTCREDSQAVGEPLAGTAAEARYFAAVSWPKALWHHDKVALSEGLPASLRELEKSARAAGHKLQLRLFQRAGAVSTDALEIVCADFGARRSAHHREVPAAHCAEVIAAFLAGDANAPPLDAPLALVCTDGKHDACCGKLGRSLVSALRADARVDTVEVSHVGGHRLAANCLVLPSGRLYGRLGVLDVPALAESIRHDRVYLPRYRGQSGLGELEQVAEAAALARLPGGHPVELGTPEPDGDGFRVKAGGVVVRCARRAFTALSSCGDAEPERRERWVLQSVLEEEME